MLLLLLIYEEYLILLLNNYSSIVAISGKDFAIVASDTRLSEGYMIYTRKQSKLFQLSDKSVLGCTGCWCDTLSLTNIIQSQLKVKNISLLYNRYSNCASRELGKGTALKHRKPKLM